MIPKCAIQADGSVLIDNTVPPLDTPFIGGIAVNTDTGAVYVTTDAPAEITEFDSAFGGGFH